MATWFQGTTELNCSMETIVEKTKDIGTYMPATVALLPGLTVKDGVRHDATSIDLETSEGKMRRENFVRTQSDHGLTISFDETTKVGKATTVKSHYNYEFVENGQGVTHTLTISDMQTSGVLGWLYRKFGARNNGNAALAAHKAYFEGE